MSADHTDLLLHNDVRWLSKGNALRRFCELRQEIVAFLQESNHKKSQEISQMLDETFVADVFSELYF